jgi:hypothetical protein
MEGEGYKQPIRPLVSDWSAVAYMASAAAWDRVPQRRMVPSALPAARIWPPGSNATEYTGACGPGQRGEQG